MLRKPVSVLANWFALVSTHDEAAAQIGLHGSTQYITITKVMDT